MSLVIVVHVGACSVSANFIIPSLLSFLRGQMDTWMDGQTDSCDHSYKVASLLNKSSFMKFLARRNHKNYYLKMCSKI